MKSRDCIVLENSPDPVTVYTDHTMHERQKGTTLKIFKVTPQVTAIWQRLWAVSFPAWENIYYKAVMLSQIPV